MLLRKNFLFSIWLIVFMLSLVQGLGNSEFEDDDEGFGSGEPAKTGAGGPHGAGESGSGRLGGAGGGRSPAPGRPGGVGGFDGFGSPPPSEGFRGAGERGKDFPSGAGREGAGHGVAPNNRAQQVLSEFNDAFSKYLGYYNNYYLPNYGIHSTGYGQYYGPGGAYAAGAQFSAPPPPQPVYQQYQPSAYPQASGTQQPQAAPGIGYGVPPPGQMIGGPPSGGVPASQPQQQQFEQQPQQFPPQQQYQRLMDSPIGISQQQNPQQSPFTQQQGQFQQPPPSGGIGYPASQPSSIVTYPTTGAGGQIECPPGYVPAWCVPIGTNVNVQQQQPPQQLVVGK